MRDNNAIRVSADPTHTLTWKSSRLIGSVDFQLTASRKVRYQMMHVVLVQPSIFRQLLNLNRSLSRVCLYKWLHLHLEILISFGRASLQPRSFALQIYRSCAIDLFLCLSNHIDRFSIYNLISVLVNSRSSRLSSVHTGI